MKKFSLLFLTAFVTGNNDRIKASRIFFLAFLFCCISNLTFAQIAVTPAPNGSAICGPVSGCVAVGNIVIKETLGNDFASGTDQITLIPPTGWEFCGSAPTFSVTIAGDVTSVNAAGFSNTSLSFTISAGGNSQIDEITITGLSVVALTPSAPNGFISAAVANGVNGVITGTTPTSTNFGNLALFPGIITGNVTVCQGDTTTLHSSDPGGVWTSANTNIGTLNPATGFFTASSAPGGTGTSNVLYTIGGCSSSTVLTVNPNPTAITNIHDICQNNCYTITSTPVTGLFTSTLVTVTNAAPIGNSGSANLCGVNAGVGSITYTLTTGCFTTATMNVNPIPQPIIDPLGTYQICAGDTRTLSSATANGVWSSQFPLIASINPTTGLLTAGANPGGVTRITYTLPTTCAIDTPFRVYPVPGAISGTDSVCVGSTVTLSNPTAGGSWTSANTGIATISSTGVVTGVSAGVVTITYMLPLGSCFVTYSVKVNPVPDPISGPHNVCVNSQITLATTSINGTWSSGSTFIATIDSVSGVLTGMFPGATTISYTFATGCSALFTVTVDPLPDTIRGSTFVCQGQCITLSDASAPVGQWQSQLPGVVSIDPVTGLACGLQVGTSVISYIFPSGCFVTSIVDVNALDTIGGPRKVCERDSILLTNTTPGGGTWSSSNTTIATIDSVTGWLTGGAVSGVSTSVVVSFTSTQGCVATTTVTVNPAPGPITGPSNVCAGSSITLSDPAAGTGGVWGSTNTVVATVVAGPGDVGVVTGSTLGAGYSVLITYTLPAGCFSQYLVKVDSLPNPITGPTRVCQGYSITLTDTYPNAAGTWTSSNTTIATIDSASGVLTGIIPGSVLVTYTLPSGCAANYSVTVDPLDSIKGDSVLCAGDSIVLSNTTIGGPGVWSSSNNAVATVNPTTGWVYGVHPGGVVNISYTLPGTGCAAVHTVTVNPQPDVFVGPNNVCTGTTIQLSSGPAGGTWTSSNPSVATVDPVLGEVGGVTAGQDTIRYTLSGTGCFRTMTLTVNGHTAIALGGNGDSVCVGSTLSLSDATTGGQWSSANTTVATVNPNTGTVTGVAQGNVIITYTTAQGCIDTITIKVNRKPFPITGIATICAHDSILLSTLDTPNGTWSATPSTVATINTVTGWLTGVQPGGVATVTFTSAFTGCSTSDTIHVNPVPKAIGGPSNICIDDSSQVFTNADTPGLWSSNNTAILLVDDTTGAATPVDTGVVIISYTFPTGCYITKTVTVRPLPTITAINTTAIICRGGTTTLIADGAGVGGTYVWSPPTDLSCVACQAPDAFPQFTTTYTVVGTTIYGCSNDTSVIVWVDSVLNHLAISADDTEICVGTCTQLHATGGQDSVYLWTPAVGLSCTNCQNPFACPTETTTYSVTAVDFLGCSRTVSFTLIVHPKPVVVVSPNPVIICKHSTTTVTASGAGVGGHYNWSPNVFLSCDTCATVVMSDTSNIIYVVTATTAFGCMDSISVKVSVLDTNVNWISNDTIICKGDTIRLTATSQSLTSNLDIPQYTWSPDYNISDIHVNNPLVWPAITTVYTVSIRANQCFTKVLHTQVTVEPLPAITTIPGSATVIAGTSVQLLATAPNVIVSSFAWAPASTLSCDSCDNPIATPTASVTVYTVTAVSSFGCVYYDTVSIHLFCDNSQIFIPNTFTPNGDGVNDRFYISGKGINTIKRFAVYNRWGQLIYERENINVNDASSGWDGTFNGIVLPPDVFYYQVSATCELGGEPFTYTGDVSIVR